MANVEVSVENPAGAAWLYVAAAALKYNPPPFVCRPALTDADMSMITIKTLDDVNVKVVQSLTIVADDAIENPLAPLNSISAMPGKVYVGVVVTALVDDWMPTET